ncbi:MAG: DUF1298 domain-containing protein [Flavobacterium sp.]|nr:MAG: DUF1298 domain-containing protein [Flavobacterium sp.]
MKKYLIIILLCLTKASGQYNIPIQLPKSPDAYLFEKYGDTPVSLYTGRPNISIPIYTIKYGDMTIPLELDYNSNGIRVDEEASSVGLGWYFGTGMISQIVQGKDDLNSNVIFKIPDYTYVPYPQYVLTPEPDWNQTNPQNPPSPISPARIITSAINPQANMNTYFLARGRSDSSFSPTDYMIYNGTLTSYLDKLEVGIMACRHVLPRVQSLLALLEEEIQTFEQLTQHINLIEKAAT